MPKLHTATMELLKAAKPKKAANTAAMQEYDRFISAVTKDKPGFLEPGDGESTRSIALSLHRAAKRAGVTIDTTTALNGSTMGVFYVQVDAKPPATPKPPKPAAPAAAAAAPGKS